MELSHFDKLPAMWDTRARQLYVSVGLTGPSLANWRHELTSYNTITKRQTNGDCVQTVPLGASSNWRQINSDRVQTLD